MHVVNVCDQLKLVYAIDACHNHFFPCPVVVLPKADYYDTANVLVGQAEGLD